MRRRHLLAALILLTVAAPAAAQSIVLVRHAERADTSGGGTPTMNTDPDLSDAGHARARRLAEILRDAGVAAIFVTEFKRTQQTAAPLAKALGVTPSVIKAADTKTLLTRLRATKAPALVVGHSNTVPEVAAALAGTPPITIADDDFGNLIVVSRGMPPSLLRLRY